ncbi:ribbon-helix-helix domain-containing protein [Sphingomonas pituitosa]|uniref:ribbon-helix-helix domain-containing protein n=1 Tax=Sphingomonas pituitosa TaxID=99597 RepID=UPI00082C20F7|nr:addiction module antitoxin [Sphingomonas pituitosa]
MTKPMHLNVRVSGPLSDFVARNVGEDGLYENVSEYVRDLIRRDKERVEREMFDTLKAELQRAFATPDGDYVYVTAEDVLERNRARRAQR